MRRAVHGLAVLGFAAEFLALANWVVEGIQQPGCGYMCQSEYAPTWQYVLGALMMVLLVVGTFAMGTRRVTRFRIAVLFALFAVHVLIAANAVRWMFDPDNGIGLWFPFALLAAAVFLGGCALDRVREYEQWSGQALWIGGWILTLTLWSIAAVTVGAALETVVEPKATCQRWSPNLYLTVETASRTWIPPDVDCTWLGENGRLEPGEGRDEPLDGELTLIVVGFATAEVGRRSYWRKKRQ